MAIVKFGVVTDTHYDDQDWFDGAGEDDRYYRDADDKMTDIVADMNAWGAGFLCHCGDNVDGAGDAGSDEWDYFLGVENNANADWYFAYGNHDRESIGESTWETKTGHPHIYYSVDVNGVHLVFLSAYHDSIDGFTDGTMHSWLTSDLAGNSLPVFVFSHYPFDSSVDGVINGASSIRSILESDGNTVACFTGHTHVGDGISTNSGILYVRMRGNVSGSYASGVNNSYAKVIYDTTADELSIDGYGQQDNYNLGSPGSFSPSSSLSNSPSSSPSPSSSLSNSPSASPSASNSASPSTSLSNSPSSSISNSASNSPSSSASSSPSPFTPAEWQYRRKNITSWEIT